MGVHLTTKFRQSFASIPFTDAATALYTTAAVKSDWLSALKLSCTSTTTASFATGMCVGANMGLVVGAEPGEA